MARVITRKYYNAEFNEVLKNIWLGMIDAAKRYDPSLGWKFETYAPRRVSGYVKDTLRRSNAYKRDSNTFRSLELLAIDVLNQQLGREPTQEEIKSEANSSHLDFEKNYDYIYSIVRNRKLFAFLDNKI